MKAGFEDDWMVLDGGLATELELRGHDLSSRLWSAEILRSAPEAIEKLHYDYFAAGARCAITASYQASFEGFAALGIDDERTAALLLLSVELARSARERYRRDHPRDRRELHVAASIGPFGAISHDGAEYRGDYGLTVPQLVSFHEKRFGILAASGADLLACETIPTLDEAQALAELLAQYPTTRAWMSFTSPDGTHTSHGEALADCARLAEGVAGVVAVGVNCVRPEVVGKAIAALRLGTGKAIVVYPNSGERWDGRTHEWEGSPDASGLAALAPQWAGSGARLIGGCCRVGPREIGEIAEALMRARFPIRRATRADLAEIRRLLECSALPIADLEDSVPFLFVARDGSALAGACGLEIFGTTGLLRSVAVHESQRGTGLGRALVRHIERIARDRGLGALVLLTTTAQEYFAGLGFAVIGRDQVPEPIRQSAEFRTLCPQSASCMSKRLERRHDGSGTPESP